MGKDLANKCISTGTVTRMEQNKASLKCFFIQMFIMNIGCSLTLLVKCLFLDRTSTVAFIMVWSVLTLKIPNDNALNICVKFALITLTVCKLHYCFYYSICYKPN